MLVEHVRGLGPSPSQLSEAGQLSETLVMLGHFDDARVLQQELSSWQALHQVRGGG